MRPFALTACWYLVPGVLWVVGSDVLLALLVTDTATLARLQVVKGLGFVVITGLLILRLLMKQQAALQDMKERYDRTERGFQLLFTNNPLPVWAFDRETLHFLEINDVALAKYGYSRDELLTMQVTDVHLPDEIPALMEVVRRPCEVRERSGFWHHRIKDGRIIEVEVQIHDLELRGRSARVVVALDITERRRQERLAQRRAARARALADAAVALNLASTVQDMVCIATEATRTILKAHAVMMRLDTPPGQDQEIEAVESCDQFAARVGALSSSIHEAVCQRVREQMAPVRLSADEVRETLGLSMAQDAPAPELGGWLAAPLVGRDGRCLGDIQVADPSAEGGPSLPPDVSFSDEDESVLVQLAQMTAAAVENARLRAEELERERRFRELVEGLDAIVWEAEWPSLHFTFVSQQFETILGYQIDTPSAAVDIFLRCIGPDEQARLAGYLDDVAAGRTSIPCELRARAADDSTVWLRIEGVARTDASGAVTRLRGLTTDITGERALAEQAARGEKLHAFGQLSSGAAHDLNQSLALIAGNTELLQKMMDERRTDDERTRELLDTIGQAAFDGGETVRRMLTFVRSPREEARSRIDLTSMVQEVVRLTAPRWRDASQAEGRPIELAVEIEGDAVIRGSAGLLREALTNLILNAVDALPHGGSIDVAVSIDGEWTTLSVTDSGVGMPEEVRARIFDPFFTTKGERGTGLGLPTVYGIVESHRGEMSVTSEPGEGSRFEMRFPLVTESDPSAGPAAHVPALTSRELGKLAATDRRILVVDDEPQLARMLATMLRHDGYVVRQAGCGEEALDLLAESPAELLITDVGMGPSMNGWELAERARDRFPGLPVILATGWGATIDADDARARGVCAILAKPYRRSDLQAVLALVPWPSLPGMDREAPDVSTASVTDSAPARAS